MKSSLAMVVTILRPLPAPTPSSQRIVLVTWQQKRSLDTLALQCERKMRCRSVAVQGEINYWKKLIINTIVTILNIQCCNLHFIDFKKAVLN